MHSDTFALVVGTRPEAIKLGPVASALAALGVAPRLLLTGQHDGLDLRGFGLPDVPTLSLGCRGNGDAHAHAADVADAVEPHIAAASLLIVQGDTSSALGGAIAANRTDVPVAHVEAGLRSHDSRHPWPEEGFRIEIDRMAAVLFAPTELSAANLRREKVAGAIHVTGNTGIDAALARPVRRAKVRNGGVKRLLVTCHRRESWGEGLASIAAALREIAGKGGVRILVVLHPNPRVASAMEELLGATPNIALQPPCSHDAMLGAMLDADLVLSDSGGMQEEAPLLGVPLLVLRERTERPEAIASGNNALVGTDKARIVASVGGLLADPLKLARMSRPSLPYGDGRAAERIARIIAEWAELRRGSRSDSRQVVNRAGLEPVFSP